MPGDIQHQRVRLRGVVFARELDVKAWNSSSAPAKFNILDYPFALTRWVTGTEPTIRPSGAALPTLLAGVDYVTPTQSDGIQRAGDDSDFFRFRAETGYRTLVADVINQSIFFEANLRYYRELGPARGTERDGEHDNLLFTAALLMSKGIYVSYSTGTLPYDLEDQQVFSVGLHYKF